MKRSSTLVTALFGAVVAVAGCGGDESTHDVPDAGPPAPDASEGGHAGTLLVPDGQFAALTADGYVVYGGAAGLDAIPVGGGATIHVGDGYVPPFFDDIVPRHRAVLILTADNGFALWSATGGRRDVAGPSRLTGLSGDDALVVHRDGAAVPGVLTLDAVDGSASIELEATEACGHALFAGARVVYEHCATPMGPHSVVAATLAGDRTVLATDVVAWELGPMGMRILAIDATGDLRGRPVDGSPGAVIDTGVVEARFGDAGGAIYVTAAGELRRRTMGGPIETITTGVRGLAGQSPDHRVTLYFTKRDPEFPALHDLWSTGAMEVRYRATATVRAATFTADATFLVIDEIDQFPKYEDLSYVRVGMLGSMPIAAKAGPSVTPIGASRIVFERDYQPPDAGPPPTSIDTMDLATGVGRAIEGHAWPEYGVTPDGARVVYSPYDEGGVYVADLP